MRIWAVIVLLLGLPLTGQFVHNGGAGNATSIQGIPVSATAPTDGTCMVYVSADKKWEPSSCSGTASTAFSGLTGSTNTTAAMLVGTGASLATTGTGTISATACATTDGCWPKNGDYGTPTTLVLTHASSLPASALPAFTGDVTTTAGSTATTVGKINGGAVPASAAVLSSNSGEQLTTAPTTGNGEVVLATSPTLVTPSLGTPSALDLTNATNLPFSALPTLPWMSCTSPGLGDGNTTIPAGTYLQTNCYNDTGHTVAITGIRCFTDNSGSSTMNVEDSGGNDLLTEAISCSTSFAAGTQSTTTTLANGAWLAFTFVSDGSTKQTSWVVEGTY